MKIFLERKLRYNGLDVGPGPAEVDDLTAIDWTKRGWATPAGKAASGINSSTEKLLEKMSIPELLEKASSMNIEIEDESEYKGKGGKKKLLALIQEAIDEENSDSGNETGNENTGSEVDSEDSGEGDQE